MERNKDGEVIDLRVIVTKVWQRKKLIIKMLIIAFVAACVYIFPVPRSYKCSIMLAPELENPATGGALSSLASSFGVNIGSALTSDAISPTLYPDLMESNDFVVSLFNVPVTTDDNELTTDYYTYLKKHQKSSIWSVPFKWIGNTAKKALASLSGDKKGGSGGGIDPFRLSEEQNDVAMKMMDKISCDIDKKTDVITITIEDQDPLICAVMADTVSARLQEFITNYRTNKSRVDLLYYEKLVQDAKKEYDEALMAYALFADANAGIFRESQLMKRTELENDVQLTFNAYSALNTQLQASKAKIQERTPAFTTLQCATVPIKASSPKRMFFVVGMMFLAFMLTALYILKDDFIRQLKNN